MRRNKILRPGNAGSNPVAATNIKTEDEMTYNLITALSAVSRNTRNKIDGKHIRIERGSAGNKMLGACDYLRGQGYTVSFCDRL